jgi:hypothetical protein
MTTADTSHIATTLVAIAAVALIVYNIYTAAKREAREKIEHAATVKFYRDMAQHHIETCNRSGGLPYPDNFNTPN